MNYFSLSVLERIFFCRVVICVFYCLRFSLRRVCCAGKRYSFIMELGLDIGVFADILLVTVDVWR